MHVSSIRLTELQKHYFRPVSKFSTEKSPNHAFGDFCHNMRRKSIHICMFSAHL